MLINFLLPFIIPLILYHLIFAATRHHPPLDERPDDSRRGRVLVNFSPFRVAQTSGKVYLKQNLMGKLILTSKKSLLLQNLPKITKNRKKSRKTFRTKNFRRQKIESCKSSETRFPEVSRRSERSSRANGRERGANGRETVVVVAAEIAEIIRYRLISGRSQRLPNGSQ